MNNKIDVSSYGIFILSIDQFTSFLKEERKSRVKKVLQLFSKRTKFISKVNKNRKLATDSTN